MGKKIYKITLLLCLSAFVAFAQGGPDPCSGMPGCQNGGGDTLGTAPMDSVPFDNPFMLMVAVTSKSTMKIDTTSKVTVTITKVSGPGSLTGGLSKQINKWAEFNDLKCDAEGQYQIKISASGLKDVLMNFVCSKNFSGPGGPGGGGGGVAKALKIGNFPATFSMGSFNILVEAVDSVKVKDNMYNGSVLVEKVEGPGTLGGTTSGNCQGGFVELKNLTVSQAGKYRFRVISGNLKPDTTMLSEAQSGGGGGGGNQNQNCISASKGERTNLGLYGASSLDLSFSPTGRLFGAISTPASLFATDDSAKTWYACSPTDSLDFGCGRGWGGRGTKVLTNSTGWVAVQTSQEAGTLTSSVISFSNGDKGSWKTALDGQTFKDNGFNQIQSVSIIALSDYWMYTSAGTAVGRINQSGVDKNGFITVSTLSGMNSNSRVNAMAVANHSSGYPLFLVIDANGMNTGGVLYEYNGSVITAVGLPGGVTSVNSVFANPNDASGDTLFITASPGPGQSKIYRTFDGGANWTDVSAGNGNWSLTDVDYSPYWTNATSGLILSIPGSAFSSDLGATWQSVQLVNNGMAVHPKNESLIFGTMGRGVVMSTNGTAGPFFIQQNYGLEAVKINQIVRTKSKSIFYVATQAGLAYTTKYLDQGMNNFDKWNAPYGQFPVDKVGDDAGVTSVAIDPNDSLHVIAGYSNGFSVTTTGITGFANVLPAGWGTTGGKADPRVRDIEFVTSSIVIAVTGGDNSSHSGSGNIWRSANGGASWTVVTPSGADKFTNGNTVVVGYGSDTVIYVGTGLGQGGTADDKGKLWKSTNLGLTWTKVNVGPSNKSNSVTEMPINDVDVDPRDNKVIYLATGINLDNAFVKSTDGGVNYTQLDVFGEGAFTSVAVSSYNPDTVYTAIRRELYVYVATNDSVFLGFKGLPGELIPDIVIGSVIAGTSTGMYTLELDLTDENTTGIEAKAVVNANDKIAIYPNPTTGILNLTIHSTESENYKIALYDLLGNNYALPVNQVQVNGSKQITLDLNELSTGAYFLTLSGVKDSAVKKVLIVR